MAHATWESMLSPPMPQRKKTKIFLRDSTHHHCCCPTEPSSSSSRSFINSLYKSSTDCGEGKFTKSPPRATRSTSILEWPMEISDGTIDLLWCSNMPKTRGLKGLIKGSCESYCKVFESLMFQADPGIKTCASNSRRSLLGKWFRNETPKLANQMRSHVHHWTGQWFGAHSAKRSDDRQKSSGPKTSNDKS